MGLFSGGLQTQQKIEFTSAGALIGAENGLSVAANKAVLGGDPGSGDGILLNDREIDLSGFGLSFYNDNSQVSVFGDATGIYFTAQSVDPDKRAEFSVDNGFDGSARFGAFAANDVDAPDVSYLLSGTDNEFRIGNDSGGASTAFISFYNINVERARITRTGEFLIAKTTSLNPAFKLQVGSGAADNRALFNPNSNYALGVRNGNFAGDDNRTFYIGASAELNAALVFSTGTGTELGRLINAGNLLIGRTAVSGLTTGVSIEVGANNSANPGRFISYGASSVANERITLYSGTTNNRSVGIGMRSVGPNSEMFFFLGGVHGGSMVPTTDGASLVFEAFTIGSRSDGSKRIQASDQGVLTVGNAAQPTVTVEKFIVDSSRAVFENDVYSVGLRSASNLNTAPFWLGATATLTPDALFSNTAGVEQFRVGNSGGISTDGGANKWKLRGENASIVVPDRSIEVEINGNIYNIPAFLSP